MLSCGVGCSCATIGEPSKFSQLVIIVGVNECEFAAGKGYPPDGFGAEFKISARIEIGAFTVDMHPPPSADEIYPLHTHQHRPTRNYHPQRNSATARPLEHRVSRSVIADARLLLVRVRCSTQQTHVRHRPDHSGVPIQMQVLHFQPQPARPEAQLHRTPP